MASVAQLIRGYARRYGIDPAAALAVARVEGGLRRGAVGDQGTSFGPFQLHRGGALPRGRSAAWASSPAGIEYAIRRMAQSGARGLRGRQAVEAIVRNFERPADPDSEVARAQALYGSGTGGGAGSTPASPDAARTPIYSARGASDAKQQLLSALISASNQRNPSGLPIVKALGALSPSRAAPAEAPSPASSPRSRAGGGADITELFYDPLGAIKDGKPIAPVGGHGDHVHFAASNARQMLAAIRKAQSLGLRVGENPYTGSVAPVHVEGSYHYRTFPGHYHGRQVGQAADFSGDAQRMAAFYRWVKHHL